MYSRLYSFLCNYNIIFERQFGFRSNHSTDHTLVRLIEKIKNYLDNDSYVCRIFIDLQRAFDTVNHDLLLQKLYRDGIRGLENDRIRSFLTNGKQMICVNGFNSPRESILCGVPQGSTLGPLLFIIYINDLDKVLKKSVVHHFADDTNLIFAMFESIRTWTFYGATKNDIFLAGSPLKIMKSGFYLRSKALSVLEIFTFKYSFEPPDFWIYDVSGEQYLIW